MDVLVNLTEKLNSPDKLNRLKAVEEIARLIKKGEITRQESEEVNNHVHTIYSFSPYSPSSAAYHAWKAGLKTIGIMDHDSIAGGAELIQACKILGL
ncbi:MAG: PHP domain-containing protein, partial [Candidatus Caldatribacteriota bacterium]